MKPEFNINDTVYHITPESPQGVVIDISYSYLTKLHQYLVTFEIGQPFWYYGHELSKTKIYN